MGFAPLAGWYGLGHVALMRFVEKNLEASHLRNSGTLHEPVW
jgi:hypothetical protein